MNKETMTSKLTALTAMVVIVGGVIFYSVYRDRNLETTQQQHQQVETPTPQVQVAPKIDERVQPKSNNPKSGESAVTDEIKKAFIEGCLADGLVSYDFCNCGYDYIVEKIGKKDMVTGALDLLEGVTNEEIERTMAEATVYCMEKHGLK